MECITVETILSQHVPENIHYSTLAGDASLSQKPWVENYPPILNPQLRSGTYASVNQGLCLDQYLSTQSQTSASSIAGLNDEERLKRLVYPLNPSKTPEITSECDVYRDFLKEIAEPLSLAWYKDNYIMRSQTGTPGYADHNKVIDHLFTWLVDGSSKSEGCAVVGEMKRFDIIKVREWSGEKTKSSTTLRLGKELRG